MTPKQPTTRKKKKINQAANSLANELISSGLIDELLRLKREGKALGLFMEDRDPLECPKCHLFEDVTFEGLHLVTTAENPDTDSGLRFEEVGKEMFRCPACGKIFKMKPWEIAIPERVKK